jgi:hypothetical protein
MAAAVRLRNRMTQACFCCQTRLVYLNEGCSTLTNVAAAALTENQVRAMTVTSV